VPFAECYTRQSLFRVYRGFKGPESGSARPWRGRTVAAAMCRGEAKRLPARSVTRCALLDGRASLPFIRANKESSKRFDVCFFVRLVLVCSERWRAECRGRRLPERQQPADGCRAPGNRIEGSGCLSADHLGAYFAGEPATGAQNRYSSGALDAASA
jgi:hypothetical protein